MSDGTLQLVPNVSECPRSTFEGGAVPPGVEAIVHTHPGGCEWPSYTDQAQQIATGLPWIIVPEGGRPFAWGTRALAPPLLGRTFRWGVTDCYAAVRDALQSEFGIALGNYPREWDFWHDGPEFEMHTSAEGWTLTDLPPLEAAPGDVVLFKIRSRYYNHAALVLEPGRIYHHPTGRGPVDHSMLARVDTLAKYERIPTGVVRLNS
jgi:cell wall-associated NlpC family hydrolase